ncbi:hypothetical protein CLOM_g1810 [Closterium sp. NIES-68]|nr:hypothetical protein CLOM_g1810 [Closterium sp. NIES-68]GJP75191.1 hypothetical protein CLOP_g5666 [Closterium sp. NIES-67]
MAQRSLSAFAEKYEVREDLGKGQYGVVAECAERISGRRLACKVVAARKQALDAAEREVAALSLLKGCENIVTIEDVYIGEGGKGMVLVMELASGGDLLSRIEQKGRIPEYEARELFKGVAMALKQCHANGVIHRDVKPDNVLLFPPKTSLLMRVSSEDSPSPSPRLSLRGDNMGRGCGFTTKLADFGIAKMLAPGEKIDGYAGSFPYEAPEVLAGKSYDFSADIWSLGVTLYAMLSGKWPTFANGRRSFDESKDWDAPCWWITSSRAKDLIRSMLTTDPKIRPSIDEVLANPWVCGASSLFSSSSTSPRGAIKPPAFNPPAAAAACALEPAASPRSVVDDPSSSAFMFPLATLTIKTTCRTVKTCRKLASDVLKRKQWRRHGACCTNKLSPCNSSLSRRSSKSQRSSFSGASARLSARVADMAVAAVAEVDSHGTAANVTKP